MSNEIATARLIARNRGEVAASAYMSGTLTVAVGDLYDRLRKLDESLARLAEVNERAAEDAKAELKRLKEWAVK